MSAPWIVASLQVGQRETLSVGRRRVASGIRKRPVEGPLAIQSLGVAGDAVCDTRYHGGPDQAVYVYLESDYRFWERQYRRPFEPGEFGENITLSGGDDRPWMIGDQLRVGSVQLEVTAPRIPCGLFESHMGIKGFTAAFAKANRSGFYCRVLRPGQVKVGDVVELAPSDFQLSIQSLFLANYASQSREALESYLEAPIDQRTREKMHKALKALK